MLNGTIKVGVASALSTALKRPVSQEELNDNVNLFTEMGIDSITVIGVPRSNSSLCGT